MDLIWTAASASMNGHTEPAYFRTLVFIVQNRLVHFGIYVKTFVFSIPMPRRLTRPDRRRRDRQILLDLIREVRERSKLPQTEVARRMGISQSNYSKYERGDRRIDLLDLAELCDATDMPLEEVVRKFAERRRTGSG